MTKELAQYLFLEEKLYHFPVRAEMPQGGETDAVPSTTTKPHAWFFGEKPMGEKRDLMVKLLQACQLKASDVEFYFESHLLQEFMQHNRHLQTLIVFGPNAGTWVADWPIKTIHTHENTSVLSAFSLDELVQNKQQEKRQFWVWLQHLYKLS